MTTAEYLARFPGPLRLYPPRWSYLVGVPIGLFFLGLSLTYEQRTAFWIGILLSSFAIVASILSVSPLANSLTLRNNGFEVRFSFRRMAIPWHQAHNFAALDFDGEQQVMFSNDGLSSAGASEFGGRNASLGRTYGLSAEDLADLMSQWRTRAMSTTTP
jgi:hypothetical protein